MTRLVGITGGMGAGKSSVLTCLARGGHKTLDCDSVVHELYEAPDSPLVQRIRDRWGDIANDAQGGLNRQDLARRVFSNPDDLHWLNAQIHPLVWHRIEQVAGELSAGDPLFCAVPLLFEVGWQCRFAATLSVWCDPTTQLDRLRSRGWARIQIEQRRAVQMNMDEKLQRADFGIVNNSSWSILHEQVTRIALRLTVEMAER